MGLLSAIGGGTLLLLYWQAIRDRHTDDIHLLAEAKPALSQAFTHYNQFLKLLEFRVAHTLEKGDLERLPGLLSQKIEETAGAFFPIITSIHFILASDPSVLYSRLGKTYNTYLPHLHNALRLLGKGLFQECKSIYGTSGKNLGTLQVSFSVKHLIHQYLSEEDLRIIPRSENLKNQLSLSIEGLPYVFLFNHPDPSFWQYARASKFYFLGLVVISCAAIFIGALYGRSWHGRRRKKLCLEYRSLRDQLEPLQEECACQKSEIEKLTQILQLKTEAERGKNRLSAVFHEKFRQIAIQALGLNTLLTKLLSEDSEDSKAKSEFRNIAQESSNLLKRLVKGHPIAETDQVVDCALCFEKIQTLLSSEIFARELVIKKVGKIKEPLFLDQFLFEFVLYNLFHKILDRSMKGGLIKVEFKNTTPLQIVFYDTGYDMEESERALKITPDLVSVLNLSKSQLQELVHSFGWQLLFTRERGPFHNSITLSIPRPLPANASSKVINLFDPQKTTLPELENCS